MTRSLSVLLLSLCASFCLQVNCANAVGETPDPVFPIAQCSFDINFMNSNAKGVSKTCAHLAPGTKYLAILSGWSIRADAVVKAGTIALQTPAPAGGKTAIAFSIAAKADGSIVWTSPGPATQEGTVAGNAAVVTIRFEGCVNQNGDTVNCAVAGTLTIRVDDP